MISGLTLDDFVTVLHKHLSPTYPIQSQEHLFGRTRQLQAIEQALYAPGRSVFIYGDRGVGKTSLAHTAAYAHQGSTHDPVLLACTPSNTFATIMTDVLDALAPKHATTATTHSAKRLSRCGT